MPDSFKEAQLLDRNPEFVEALLNASANLILVLDSSGLIVRFNRSCEEATGYHANDVLGRSLFDIFLQPDDREIKRSAFQAICRDSLQAMKINEAEVIWLDKKGALLCVEWNYTALSDENGQVCYVVSVGTEVTQQRRIERALRESEERYALALQGANDGIWDWNLETGEVYYSPRWKAMLGYEDHEIVSICEEWRKRVHPADCEGLQTAIQRHMEGKTPHLECEYRILHKDDTYRWMLVRGLAIRNEEGQPHRMAGSQTDMTERKIAEQQLLHDVFHDSLTGLPNRVVFLERVTQMLARAKRREEYRFAILFLDLNNFKTVNDTLGHVLGDQLLKAVAARLKKCLRRDDTIAREAPHLQDHHAPLADSMEVSAGKRPKPTSGNMSDLVARLGGDEFTVVLEDVADVNEVRAVAKRISEELDRPFHISGHVVQAGVSIGIVLSSPLHQTPEELIAQADAAMYEAKEKARTSGQSQVFVFGTG